MEKLKILYHEVEQRLQRVDFSRLWPGFHPFGFALYEENRACVGGALLPRPGVFRGNTAVRWEGGLLAIWNVGGEAGDLDLLASNLVHEMFHAFQEEQDEVRFPDDLAALDYPLDVENLSMKLAENRLLCRALREPGDGLARLNEACTLREARRERIGTLLDQELLPETVEGMAEYMGLCALRALSEEKYRSRVEEYLGRMEEAGPLLLDVRRMSYYTGAVLLLAAESAGVPFIHALAGEARPVYALLRRHLTPGAAPAVQPEERMRVLIRQRNEERQAQLAQFFQKAAGPVSGDFEIQGYDPMNMYKVGQQLYGSHFWLLYDRTGGRTVELGEAVLLSAGGRQVSKYWTA